ncbi:hypothetical protein ACTAQI_00050 [Pseudarthrobacter sp. alpha12b]
MIIPSQGTRDGSAKVGAGASMGLVSWGDGAEGREPRHVGAAGLSELQNNGVI